MGKTQQMEEHVVDKHLKENIIIVFWVNRICYVKQHSD